MPREGITAYDLLISCPSDVEEYLEIIKEGIGSFNRYFGTVNKIEIVGAQTIQSAPLSYPLTRAASPTCTSSPEAG